jgi:hypothetical protein
MLEQPVDKLPSSGWKRVLASISVAAVIFGIVGYLVFAIVERSKAAATREMKEQAVAFGSQLEISEVYINGGKNMLGDHVSYVNLRVTNHVNRPVRLLVLTFTFVDINGQRVLVESRPVVDERKVPLQPNEWREFAIGFEHISVDWNHQHPSIIPTLLKLGS